LARRPLFLTAALLCAAAFAVSPATAAAVGDCTPAASWPATRADLATQVVDLINAHRARLGLAALVVSPTLTAAATWKARHMSAYGYMDHDDPAPPAARTAGQRIAACGYPSGTWGENIAEGYTGAQAVVDGWLSSPGHRANLENPIYRATGVAAAGAPLYWAQTFGAVVDAAVALPTPPATATVPPPEPAPASRATAGPSASQLRVSCAQRGRRVTCRVRDARGAVVRLALRRGGRTFARVRMRAEADPVRVALHPVRRLRAGHYVLVARAGALERRLELVVR
jgi:uncharacterized protein YkwD